MDRREFLRIGMAGLAGMSLPGLMRLRAEAGEPTSSGPTALIVVFLHGGASHLETYDPKPAAPKEFRGPYTHISTTVPGLDLCELLPGHAKLAGKYTMLRSLVHTGFCHGIGQQQMFTGHDIRSFKPQPDHPECFAITNRLRHKSGRGLPNYVGVSPIPYLGAAYLGPTWEPFAVNGDPNDPAFSIPNIGLTDQGLVDRLDCRRSLRTQLDSLERQLNTHKTMQALDTFEQMAFNVLTQSAARRAFDLSLEDPRIRDRYGRNRWGQQCLMARRLVESGVDLVTTTLAGPECGRVQNWDDHAVNHHVFDAMKARAPLFDQAVSALIEDLYERGLDKRVMVIVTGEFGRTPRISYAADSASGVMQPGRDHWPNATSLLFAGGGIATGQVIGGTDPRGEQVIERRVGVGDFLATIYRHLQVDVERVAFEDFSGRPIPILQQGRPIPELVAG
jgi:hypothetical protein